MQVGLPWPQGKQGSKSHHGLKSHQSSELCTPWQSGQACPSRYPHWTPCTSSLAWPSIEIYWGRCCPYCCETARGSCDHACLSLCGGTRISKKFPFQKPVALILQGQQTCVAPSLHPSEERKEHMLICDPLHHVDQRQHGQAHRIGNSSRMC